MELPGLVAEDCGFRGSLPDHRAGVRRDLIDRSHFAGREPGAVLDSDVEVLFDEGGGRA